MSIHKAKPEHEVAYQDLCALASKHANKLTSLELLAVAANMLGKLIALQDQRTVTREIAMETVLHGWPVRLGNSGKPVCGLKQFVTLRTSWSSLDYEHQDGRTEMTNALDWIRNNARQVSIETNVELGDARYNITHHTFRGTIPPRMVYEVRKLYGNLKSTDEINETLRVGGEYRSQFGQCEYHRRVYERLA